jgi:preprotein translocase SecE subunit
MALPSEGGRPEEPTAPSGGGGWFQDTIAELGRVVWPTREELFRMTGVVLVTVTAIAIYIAAIDALLTQITKPLYGANG